MSVLKKHVDTKHGHWVLSGPWYPHGACFSTNYVKRVENRSDTFHQLTCAVDKVTLLRVTALGDAKHVTCYCFVESLADRFNNFMELII